MRKLSLSKTNFQKNLKDKEDSEGIRMVVICLDILD